MKPTQTIINETSLCSTGYINNLNNLFTSLTKNLEANDIEYLAELLAWQNNQDLYDFFEPCCILCTTNGTESKELIITFKKLNDPEAGELNENALKYITNGLAFERLDESELWPCYNEKQILTEEYFILTHTFEF